MSEFPPGAPERTDDAVLDDLRARLRATRRARLPRGTGWSRGVDDDALTALLAAWAEEYDWRPHEERIRRLPWVSAEVPGVLDGVSTVRAIHQRADGPTAVLLHGWPDSVLRFERVLPLLHDVDVVVPALPGYPFAPPLTSTGASTTAMADLVAALLRSLGRSGVVASGGDIGSSVAEALAVRHPDLVGALHLTDVPMAHLQQADPDQLDDEARRSVEAAQRWQAAEGGYNHEQSTKPHTLAVALADSPAGTGAWILEKLRSWSDCGGDVKAAFPRDDLLTWLTAYWVTGSVGTSFSPYVEPRDAYERVEVPAAFTLFPQDLVPPTRAFAERTFDVRVWDQQGAGGHFGAWEQPEAFAAGVRAAVDLTSR